MTIQSEHEGWELLPSCEVCGAPNHRRPNERPVEFKARRCCSRTCGMILARRDADAVTHGHTRGNAESPTYQSWQAMRSRCRYLARDVDRKHIGRGITVCSRWERFENFLADMGERPAGTTLDRWPDNDGNYEPGNCRWATPRDQARNTRRSRLTLETATEVAVARLSGEGCRAIADRYGISESLPREIVRGRCWPDALAAARLILEAGQ